MARTRREEWLEHDRRGSGWIKIGGGVAGTRREWEWLEHDRRGSGWIKIGGEWQ